MRMNGSNMDESHKHSMVLCYGTKECTLYHYICIKIKTRQDYYVRIQDSDIAGWSGILFLDLDSGYMNIFIMWKFIKWHIFPSPFLYVCLHRSEG